MELGFGKSMSLGQHDALLATKMCHTNYASHGVATLTVHLHTKKHLGKCAYLQVYVGYCVCFRVPSLRPFEAFLV